MRTAISYVRWSSRDQSKGDSLRRQTKRTDLFCQRHKLKLDQTRIDDGLSAYKGHHCSVGKLGEFLSLIKNKEVKKGTVLIVEKLDRLSRLATFDSLDLVIRQILREGVDIGVVDSDRIYTAKDLDDPMTMMEMVLKFSVANEEIRKRAENLQEAWHDKRQTATSYKTTGRCPGWLEPDQYGFDQKGKRVLLSFKIIPERAKIVKRIFQLTLQGYGRTAILKKLIAEGVPSFDNSHRPNCDKWSRSYLGKILNTKAVFGEFQPRQAGKTVGEPIPGYFPAVIDETLYYRVQQALASRKTTSGKPGKGVPNLFTHILVNAYDGSPMTIVRKGRKASGPQLVSGSMKDGTAPYTSFPYDVFESAYLASFRELTIQDISKPVEDNGDMVEKLEANVFRLTCKMEKLKAKLMNDDDFDTGLDLLKQLETERKAKVAELEKARSEATANEAVNLKETQSLVEALAKTEDKDEIRTTIKARLRSMIERIELFIYVKGKERLAFVSTEFKNGQIKQMVLINNGQSLTVKYADKLANHPSFESFFETVKALIQEMRLELKQKYPMAEIDAIPTHDLRLDRKYPTHKVEYSVGSAKKSSAVA
jgi:DNA invertase Pin-like site-specific DNA recombinase